MLYLLCIIYRLRTVVRNIEGSNGPIDEIITNSEIILCKINEWDEIVRVD